MNKRYYSYNEFREDLYTLIDNIDEKFDTILPIARGGLFISLMLSEYYNIRKVYCINTIGYDDTKKLNSVEVSNIPNLTSSHRVLIVDDIVDSGDTLIKVLDILKREYPNITFYSASMFYRDSAKIKPNWYVQKSNDWIEFFWEQDLIKENNEI